ncbi:MAG: ferredoxin family protein [Syntrophobacteraceae bacterium]
MHYMPEDQEKALKSENVGGSGQVVGREPQAKQRKKALRAYEIDIFRDWCKCCGICAAFCPRECLKLNEDGAPIVVASERCTGCGWCEVHCPDFAISVKEKRIKKGGDAVRK